MGIISADVVHNISTPKQDAKVLQPLATAIMPPAARAEQGRWLGGLLNIS